MHEITRVLWPQFVQQYACAKHNISGIEFDHDIVHLANEGCHIRFEFI
jgi:hypothetical protein